MDEYDRHEVSAKLAIYSRTAKEVLVMAYAHGIYGLPGGHLDAGETPDVAVRREMREEIGREADAVTPREFFATESGKLILGYTATLDQTSELAAMEPDKETPQWVGKDEVDTLPMSEMYKAFVKKHWPEA